MDCRVLLIQQNADSDIEGFLAKNGCDVSLCESGTAAIGEFKAAAPDIVVLDADISDRDGLQICRELRGISDVPLIMISKKTDVFDKVLALELGADDYMESPADAHELFARIKAIMRRCSARSADAVDETVRLDNMEISLQRYVLKLKGKPVRIPPKELELLYYLASNCNVAFTRDQLLDKVWGYEYYCDSRTVDVHIKRIREKLKGVSEHWKIETVWGHGYKFELID